MYMNWSTLDYARPEVSQLYLDRIAAICREQDWDGLGLGILQKALENSY